MAEQSKPTVVIKKVKKVAGGAHGGSWKVAYADFVTAMMAFFLLMWLLSMTPQQKKEGLAVYFKTFSIFENKGQSAIEMQPSGENLLIPGMPADAGEKEKEAKEKPKTLVEVLKEEIQSVFPDFSEQIMFNTMENGLRIEITDKDNTPLFMSGSAQLTPIAKKLLEGITDKVLPLEAKIAVEGHTDAKTYRAGPDLNWELSANRALNARKEMQARGFPASRIIRVSGYAAQVPLIKDNPDDPRNRRLSLMLVFREGRPPAEEQKNATETGDAKFKAGQTKKDQDPVEDYIQSIYRGLTY